VKRYPIIVYARACIYFTLYGLVKYFPTPLGDVLRYAVLKIFMKRINTTYIRDGATFLFPENISIGKNACINEWVWMDGSGGIEIGSNVLFSPGVCIISFNHGFKAKDKCIAEQDKELGAIVIEDDVWLGAGSKVLKGVRIGKGSIVGAGSVVTEDIPAYSICVGSPAKVISKR